MVMNNNITSTSRKLQLIKGGNLTGTDGAFYDKIELEQEYVYNEIDDTSKDIDLKKGDYSMDNDKILEKYMDMVNQDRRDMEKRLMEDRRESEARSEERFARLEKKIDSLSDKIDSHKSFLWGIIVTAFIGVGGFVWALIQVVAVLK